MESTTWKSWLASFLVFIGVLAGAGVVLSGCSPAEDRPAAEPAPKPVAQPLQPAAEKQAPTSDVDTQPPVTPESPETQPSPEPEAPPAAPAAEPEQPSAEPEAPPAAPAAEPEQPSAEPPAETQQPPAAPAEPPPGEPSATFKVSTFAPAKDITRQVEYYLERVEESVESEETYNDSVEKIAKDSNTLVVLALALGLHDEDNEYKASAGALLKAAQQLAASGDFASARTAVDAVKAAAAGEANAEVELKWEKVASLPELMKQVPLVNTKLKRYIKRNRPDDCAAFAAEIAVIAHGTMANAADTEKPNEVEKWKQFSIQMRDAAAAVSAAVRSGDAEASTAAMEKLQQSCDACHAVFHEEELAE
jgi:hypothetical protein